MITHVGTTGATAGSPPRTLALPAGWAAGDVVIAVDQCEDTVYSISSPAGWTLILDTASNPGGTNVRELRVWYRVLTASETDPVSWTGNINAANVLSLHCYRGVDTSAGPLAAAVVVERHATNPAQGDGVAPGVAAGTNVQAIAIAGVAQSSGVPALNSANGYTSRAGAGTTIGSDCAMRVADKYVTDAVSGGVVEPEWTWGGSDRCTAIVLLLDAVQPKALTAAAEQPTEATAALVAFEASKPLRATAVQSSGASWSSITKRSSRNTPRRELVWISGLDGVQRGVIG